MPMNQSTDSTFTARLDPNRPLYKPKFWDRVQYLDRHTNQEDPTFSCDPRGVPRVGTPQKILQTAKEIFLSRVEYAWRAVRSIDVKPEVELISDARHCFEWIDNARIDRACARHHAAWPQPFAQIVFDPFPQQVDTHALPIVARNDVHLIASKAENVCRFRDRHVDLFRCIHDQRRARMPETSQ